MSEEEKINLENATYKVNGKRINSPISQEAMKMLGLEEKDMYDLSFEQYLKRHFEAKTLDKELQKERYDHYKETREKLLNEAIQKRKELLNNEEKSQSKKKKKKTQEIENIKEENEQKENENKENEQNENKENEQNENKENEQNENRENKENENKENEQNENRE